jgi:hypothetical protein
MLPTAAHTRQQIRSIMIAVAHAQFFMGVNLTTLGISLVFPFTSN